VLFLISVILIIAISYTTAPQPEAQIQGLTFASVSAEQRAENRASWGWKEVAGTSVVLGLVLGVYIYFSFWL
jgi:SSS family solute:Na+ symporter